MVVWCPGSVITPNTVKSVCEGGREGDEEREGERSEGVREGGRDGGRERGGESKYRFNVQLHSRTVTLF